MPTVILQVGSEGQEEGQGGGVCLLCQNPNGGTAAGGGAAGSQNELGLKMMLRYLNISVEVQQGGAEGSKRGLESSSKNDTQVSGMVVARSLCEDCSALVATFLEVYHEFERVRMGVCEFVEIVSDQLRSAGAGVLKEEVVRQCQLKLLSFTRVVVLKNGAVEVRDFKRRKLSTDEKCRDGRRGLLLQDTSTVTQGDDEVKVDIGQVFVKHEPEKAHHHHYKPDDDDDDMDDDDRDRMSYCSELENPLSLEEECPEIQISLSDKLIDLQENDPLEESLVETSSSIIGGRNNNNVRVKVGPNRKKCIYCGYISSNSTHSQSHMIVRHPKQYFSAQLPHWATEEDVDKALENIFQSGLVLNSGKDSYQCNICGGKVFKAYSKKVHTWREHMHVVLASLNDIIATSAAEDFQVESISTADLGHQPQLQKKKKQKKKMFKKAAQNADGITAETPCRYCGTTFSAPQAHRTHLKLVHTYQHYQHQLPERTTRNELERALQELSTGLVLLPGGGTSHRYHCNLCGIPRNSGSKKLHLLNAHFPELQSKLGTHGEGSQNTPPHRNSINKKVTHLAKKQGGRSGPRGMNGSWKTCGAKKSSKHHRRCNYCGVTVSQIQNHMISAHPLIQFSRKLPPGTSLENFHKALKSVLSQDFMVWKGKNMIQCSLCGRVRSAASRKHHALIHHVDVVVSTLVNQLANGEPHQEPVVKLEPAPVSRRKGIKCRICAKSFTTRRSYQLHMKIHKKPPIRKIPRRSLLKCASCKKVFSREIDHRNHMMTIHTRKFFEKQLPTGTTNDTLNDAIQNVIRDGRISATSSNHNQYNCSLCSAGLCSAPSKRSHVLRCHIVEILTSLKQSLDNNVPSTTTTDADPSDEKMDPVVKMDIDIL